MVERGDRGRDEEYPPVAVEGQERERTEHMEVSFESPTREVNEQRRREHLRSGDDVPGIRPAGPHEREEHRQRHDHPTERNGGPDVRVSAAGGSGPCERRHPQRQNHHREPLEQQQTSEHPVGALVHRVPVARNEFVYPRFGRPVRFGGLGHARPF